MPIKKFNIDSNDNTNDTPLSMSEIKGEFGDRSPSGSSLKEYYRNVAEGNDVDTHDFQKSYKQSYTDGNFAVISTSDATKMNITYSGITFDPKVVQPGQSLSFVTNVGTAEYFGQYFIEGTAVEGTNPAKYRVKQRNARNLGIPNSGAISFSDFYDTEKVDATGNFIIPDDPDELIFEIDISGDYVDFNLKNYLENQSGYINQKNDITNLVVNCSAGSQFGSSSPSIPAFKVQNLPAHMYLELNVYGRILGKGGTGGSAQTNSSSALRNGGTGGTALYFDHPDDKGEINVSYAPQQKGGPGRMVAAGGGGGAAGYAVIDGNKYGCGGGGGAGYGKGGDGLFGTHVVAARNAQFYFGGNPDGPRANDVFGFSYGPAMTQGTNGAGGGGTLINGYSQESGGTSTLSFGNPYCVGGFDTADGAQNALQQDREFGGWTTRLILNGSIVTTSGYHSSQSAAPDEMLYQGITYRKTGTSQIMCGSRGYYSYRYRLQKIEPITETTFTLGGLTSKVYVSSGAGGGNSLEASISNQITAIYYGYHYGIVSGVTTVKFNDWADVATGGPGGASGNNGSAPSGRITLTNGVLKEGFPDGAGGGGGDWGKTGGPADGASGGQGGIAVHCRPGHIRATGRRNEAGTIQSSGVKGVIVTDL